MRVDRFALSLGILSLLAGCSHSGGSGGGASVAGSTTTAPGSTTTAPGSTTTAPASTTPVTSMTTSMTTSTDDIDIDLDLDADADDDEHEHERRRLEGRPRVHHREREPHVRQLLRQLPGQQRLHAGGRLDREDAAPDGALHGPRPARPQRLGRGPHRLRRRAHELLRQGRGQLVLLAPLGPHERTVRELCAGERPGRRIRRLLLGDRPEGRPLRQLLHVGHGAEHAEPHVPRRGGVRRRGQQREPSHRERERARRERQPPNHAASFDATEIPTTLTERAREEEAHVALLLRGPCQPRRQRRDGHREQLREHRHDLGRAGAPGLQDELRQVARSRPEPRVPPRPGQGGQRDLDPALGVELRAPGARRGRRRSAVDAEGRERDRREPVPGTHCAILIIWDDFGGFYDHVAPPQVDALGLGFRVPASS